MSKFTIIVEDKGLEKLVLSVLDVLKSIPQIQTTQTGATFIVQPWLDNKKLPNEEVNLSLGQRFEQFFQKWKNETLLSSKGTDLINHPAYQTIIQMGESVVPFILIKLKEAPHHLFYALLKITGENPVAAAHVGNLKQMTEDWLNWGREKGYLN